MFDIMALRIIWNDETPATPFMGFRDLHVNPSPDFPFGQKGLAIRCAWEQIGEPNESVGCLILDGDVAIDPYDNRQMHDAIWNDPCSVHVAKVRIWPISHLGNTWLWGHGKDGKFTQEDISDPNMFSFCFTYLPAELLYEARRKGLENWSYPRVDMNMWETAHELGIKVKLVPDCWPKHMHFLCADSKSTWCDTGWFRRSRVGCIARTVVFIVGRIGVCECGETSHPSDTAFCSHRKLFKESCLNGSAGIDIDQDRSKIALVSKSKTEEGNRQ